MAYGFRWNDWNLDHVAGPGVAPQEAEEIVRTARRPYPRQIGDDKIVVRGRTQAGDYLQVIYVIDPDNALFVIHACPLTGAEKRQIRRAHQ